MRILIISPQPWEGLQLSKHHYARALSKMGHDVWFLNPPTKWTLKAQKSWISEEDNVQILHSKLPLPFRLISWSKFMKSYLLERWIIHVKDVVGRIDMVWNFDNYSGRIQSLKPFGAKHNLLHIVDNSPGMAVGDLESDMVVGVTPAVLSNIKTTRSKYHVPHAISPLFVENSRCEYKPGYDKIRIGYFGNLSFYALDYSFIIKAINKMDNVEWHFWGPMNHHADLGADHSLFLKLLQTKDNVFWHGSKTTKKLISDVRQKRINSFMLFYRTEIVEARGGDSNKIREYLSFGIPILSHLIKQFSDTGLIEMPEKSDKWTIDHFERKLHNLAFDSVQAEKQRNNSREVTYEINGEKILSLL